MLTANVGGFDRAVRLIVGPALMAAGLWIRLSAPGSQGTLLAIIGLLVLTTGLIRFCILYVPFGISTRAGARRPAQR